MEYNQTTLFTRPACREDEVNASHHRVFGTNHRESAMKSLQAPTPIYIPSSPVYIPAAEPVYQPTVVSQPTYNPPSPVYNPPSPAYG
uniref:Uncharacterized protein n=1 Tax=Daphnia galeata TaxID=27404 RepID=A0A8J2RRL7_9CRUS|nr:unnamed protein product [Daphnia galeata]